MAIIEPQMALAAFLETERTGAKEKATRRESGSP